MTSLPDCSKAGMALKLEQSEQYEGDDWWSPVGATSL
jgi:hypothetical protein